MVFSEDEGCELMVKVCHSASLKTEYVIKCQWRTLWTVSTPTTFIKGVIKVAWKLKVDSFSVVSPCQNQTLQHLGCFLCHISVYKILFDLKWSTTTNILRSHISYSVLYSCLKLCSKYTDSCYSISISGLRFNFSN